MSIFLTEADIAKVKDIGDRRELRNFSRFLRLWPSLGYDMVCRPRWQKYLALSDAEVAAMTQRHVWTPPKASP